MKEKLILLILFLSINFCFGLRWTTLQPNNTFNWTEITPSFSYLRRSFTPFVAAIVPQGSNLFNCEPIKTNLTGRIALVAFGNCSIDKHMEYVSKAGALGMLLISDGWRVCNNRDQNPNNLTLPTICIDSISTSFKSFLDKFLNNLKERKSTYIDFIPGRNPFDELNKGGMEFRRAWMIFFSSLLIIFSSYKIFKFLRLEKKKKLIITNIIFCFLFGVTLMINNIDFFSYFRVILNFQFQIVYNNLKYLLFFPNLSLLAIIQLRILLKVYGKESSRIIAILIMPIICIFVEVPIIIGMITFSTYKRDPNLFKILNICICIFFGINVLIYWVGSFLLLHRIFKSPDDTLIKKKSTKYLRFSISTILCGLMILFGLICMIYTTVDPYILNNMIEMITVYTLLDNFLLASCFLMTFIFKDSNINNHPATTMTKSINTMSNLDLLKEQYN